jgi:Ribbon-helix-helix protein, copG family
MSYIAGAMGYERKLTSVRLTVEALDRLAEVARGLGISRSAALEIAIRQFTPLADLGEGGVRPPPVIPQGQNP